jgi:hypothetical protein
LQARHRWERGRNEASARGVGISAREVKQLPRSAQDATAVTGEPLTGEDLVEELFAMWEGARHDASDAWHCWREDGGSIAYAVYRAAEDRADAAQDALAAAAFDLVEKQGVSL